MGNMDNPELLREQLRVKARELRKQEAEKERYKTQAKKIMVHNEETIKSLKEQLSAKTSALMATRGALDQKSREMQISDKKEYEQTQIPETRDFPVSKLDPRILDGIHQLRSRNQDLRSKIEQESAHNEKLSKEKKTLVSEIHRLRDQPQEVYQLKNKISNLESERRRTIPNYERLLEEKQEIIESYEQVLYNSFGEGEHDPRTPEAIFKDLHADLEGLKVEKDDLKKYIHKERMAFQRELKREVDKAESAWAAKYKKARQRKPLAFAIGDDSSEDDMGAPIWMVTFSDMATLLLTFFILYYSISAVNLNKFKEAILGEEAASIGLLEMLDSVQVKERIADLAGLKSKDILSELIVLKEKKILHQKISIGTDRSRIVVNVPGHTLFLPGQADLQISARDVLDEVIHVIKNFPEYKINIQGHTDDSPIATERFPTNWELSSTRATAVLRYFIDKGIPPERLTATGFADLFPISPNDTEMGRAKNRRVKIVLEKEKR